LAVLIGLVAIISVINWITEEIYLRTDYYPTQTAHIIRRIATATVLADQGVKELYLDSTIGKVVSSVAWSPDGRLASGYIRTVIMWDLESGEPGQFLHIPSGDYAEVAWSPDGRLASNSDDTVIIWDLETGEPEQVFQGHSEAVFCLAWSPDGRLASGSLDRLVIVWDLESGEPEQVLQGHSAPVSSVAWSPDGRLASSSGDGTVIIWDLESGEPEQVLQGHESFVSSVAWSPDERLASGSSDRTVIVWDLESGKPAQVLRGHREGVKSVAWSPDGRLASGSRDGYVIVWDLEGGWPDLYPTGYFASVNSLAWSTDGQLASCSDHIVVWDMVKIMESGFPSNWSNEGELIDQVINLSELGNIDGALHVISDLQSLYPEAENPEWAWNALCWYGSLWGRAADVIEACDTAVSLAPENGGIVDSRGLARALTGDVEGAIEDFRYAVEYWQDRSHNDVRFEELITERQMWIEELEGGRNPFDEEALSELLNRD
jgi:WD40 repeat protein